MLEFTPTIYQLFSPQIIEIAETEMQHFTNFTLFLPDEQAVHSWVSKNIESGKVSSVDFLLQLLHYHILPTAVFTKDLQPLQVFLNPSLLRFLSSNQLLKALTSLLPQHVTTPLPIQPIAVYYLQIHTIVSIIFLSVYNY